MPSFENIIQIPVYQRFLLRGLHESLVREKNALQREGQERAEKMDALLREEQAVQREEQERAEKERLRRLLQKHGIDPS